MLAWPRLRTSWLREKGGGLVTWVKSTLLQPDGSPVVGRSITAVLVADQSWLADHSGQVLRTIRDNTNESGIWRMQLLPSADFESADYVYYQIHEGRDMPAWTIRVPRTSSATAEYWMRDLVVDIPPGRPDAWRAIDTIGRLHNVDASADQPAGGAVLRFRDGTWLPRPLLLSELDDVDADSLRHAVAGDQLVMLPNGKWGVTRDAAVLALDWEPDDEHENGAWVTVHGASTRGARVHWGDGSDPTDVPAEQPVRHVFPPGATTWTVTARDRINPIVCGSTEVSTGDANGE
jgi:hypothetical protein